jgi:hypothetical protein
MKLGGEWMGGQPGGVSGARAIARDVEVVLYRECYTAQEVEVGRTGWGRRIDVARVGAADAIGAACGAIDMRIAVVNETTPGAAPRDPAVSASNLRHHVVGSGSGGDVGGFRAATSLATNDAHRLTVWGGTRCGEGGGEVGGGGAAAATTDPARAKVGHVEHGRTSAI